MHTNNVRHVLIAGRARTGKYQNNPGPVDDNRQVDAHRVGAPNHHQITGSGEKTMVGNDPRRGTGAILSRELVGQVGATSLYAATVGSPDGSNKVIAEVRRLDSVAVLPILVNGAGVRMGLFVRQVRPVVGLGLADLWEVPAGKVEPGEDPTQTAVRELREETGYIATALAPLVERVCVSPGYTTERMTIYAVTVAEPTVPQRAEDAHIVAEWWPLDRVPTRDMKTMLAVLLAQRDAGLWAEVAR